MKKRLMSLLMVAAMTSTMFVGCGSDASKETSATDAASSDAATEAAADEVVCPDEITIMVDATVFTEPNGRDQFIAKLEELTGIAKINVVQPDHDAYYDVVGQTIASGDWPDVMILGPTYLSGYASQGVLWDMTDAWNNSELKVRQTAFGGNVDVEGLMINGQLYGMPATRGNGCVTYLRQSWLDAVGMDVPTTYDEYIEVLRAFKNNDPDGDGQNNTYGASAAGFIGGEAPYINYWPEFYQDAFPSFMTENGAWVDGFNSDAMKAALQRMADAYAEGLIDPASLDQGTKDARTKYFAGEFGAFTYWAGNWAENIYQNLSQNDQDPEIATMAPIAEVGTYINRLSPAWCITSTCENPEGVFKYFIETMQDGADTQFLWTYGVEGVHWSTAAETLYADTDSPKEYAQGEFHGCDNLENPGTQYTKAHIDPKLALVELANDPGALSETAKASADLFTANCRNAEMVPSTQEMTDYNGALTTLKNTLIAKVVMGEMTVDEAYAEYESNPEGLAYSQAIVDSLNK
ncbi:MAG: extracellular solute-binding protein [Pseudobutyrivibrio sp.]|nr:extracellular solute-binding protein [Pseudobutyrivibrio sp.]